MGILELLDQASAMTAPPAFERKAPWELLQVSSFFSDPQAKEFTERAFYKTPSAVMSSEICGDGHLTLGYRGLGWGLE